MTRYRVTKNPLKSDDFEDVEADVFFEDGSYTKFADEDGVVVLAVQTQYVTKIKELKS